MGRLAASLSELKKRLNQRWLNENRPDLENQKDPRDEELEQERMQEKYGAESFTPPQSAVNNAKRGLELRKKWGRGGLSPSEAKSQGIDSGVTRARKIASGKVSTHDVRRMSAFNRHRKNYRPDKKMSDGGPTAGTIAWLLWGGTSGVNWAKKKSAAMNAETFEADVGTDRFMTDITCSFCGEPYDGTEVLDQHEAVIVHRRCAGSDDYEAENYGVGEVWMADEEDAYDEIRQLGCPICAHELHTVSASAECPYCEVLWHYHEDDGFSYFEAEGDFESDWMLYAKEGRYRVGTKGQGYSYTPTEEPCPLCGVNEENVLMIYRDDGTVEKVCKRGDCDMQMVLFRPQPRSGVLSRLKNLFSAEDDDDDGDEDWDEDWEGDYEPGCHLCIEYADPEDVRPAEKLCSWCDQVLCEGCFGDLSQESCQGCREDGFTAECDACSGTFSAEGAGGTQVFNSCWKCGSGLHLYQITRYPATPDEIAGVGGDSSQASDAGRRRASGR